MTLKKKFFGKLAVLFFVFFALMLLIPLQASAEGDAEPESTPPVYDINAEQFENPADYAGVYVADAKPDKVEISTDEKNPTTVGIPSIADANLADEPTTESPAIIQGAAVGYEEKVGPTEYKTIREGKPEPYTDYPVVIIEEKAQDGTIHKKLSGFDGTYVILRMDVTDYFKDQGEDAVLHVKQEQNYANIPFNGLLISKPEDYWPNWNEFADGYGTKTGAYTKADLIDKNDETETPYVNVLLFSSGKLAAGADVGKEGAPTGDVPVKMYVDKIKDYDEEITKYDPTSEEATKDPAAYEKRVLEKFFRDALETISNYLVKGSDLALETAVDNSGGDNKDTGTTYWSLEKAIEKPYYDQEIDKKSDDSNCGRTVKMICEVPVTDTLNLEGTDSQNLKKRTLNVNSFDIQIANNTGKETEEPVAGFNLKNAWLQIEDLSNTTGAEVAIGNNARFVIDEGGKLIIDKTCQLEIEWDGATTTPVEGETPPEQDILNNGILDLRKGGEIQNDGVITIEGPEGKPIEPVQGQPAPDPTQEKGYGELMIQDGATLTNNGCLIVYGKLYNFGTLVNNGKYGDTITGNDPDKGTYAYHKGIQISWKDDVTQAGVWPGVLINGKDKAGTIYESAIMTNAGDIVLVPGSLENYGKLINENGARILLVTATEAIIPIVPDPANPLIVTKRITLSPVQLSYLNNYGVIDNYGSIAPATVALNDDGSFGTLTIPGNLPQLFSINNQGIINNYGYIYVWEGGEGKPLLAAFYGSDTWLYLFKDGTFLMILPNGERVTGTFTLADGLLTLIPSDGTVISSALDEDGNCIINVITVSGEEFELAIKDI